MIIGHRGLSPRAGGPNGGGHDRSKVGGQPFTELWQATYWGAVVAPDMGLQPPPFRGTEPVAPPRTTPAPAEKRRQSQRRG